MDSMDNEDGNIFIGIKENHILAYYSPGDNIIKRGGISPIPESPECKVSYLDVVDNFSPDSVAEHHYRSGRYTRYLTFRSLFCELIHMGVNMFPCITKFTLTFTNEKGTKRVILDSTTKDSFFKLQLKNKCLTFTKFELVNIYVATKIEMCNYRHINSILECIYDNGNEPSIKIDYEISNDEIHKASKPKNVN